jgi:hypothetical protein
MACGFERGTCSFGCFSSEDVAWSRPSFIVPEGKGPERRVGRDEGERPLLGIDAGGVGDDGAAAHVAPRVEAGYSRRKEHLGKLPSFQKRTVDQGAEGGRSWRTPSAGFRVGTRGWLATETRQEALWQWEALLDGSSSSSSSSDRRLLSRNVAVTRRALTTTSIVLYRIISVRDPWSLSRLAAKGREGGTQGRIDGSLP